MWEITVSIGFLAVLALLTDRRTRLVVVVAYLIRMALAYVHAYVVPLPDSQFDAIRFERVAWTWAGDGQCFDDFTTGSLLYSWIGSCVYLVVGRAALVLQLANCFLGALIVLVGMRTARLLPHVRPYDRGAGWAIALYPSLVLYSAITMRETAVVVCFAASLYFLTRWASGDGYRYAVWAILWVVLSQLFHTGMVAATVTVVAVVMYVTISENWRGLDRIHVRVRDARITVASLILAGGLIGLGALALGRGFGFDKLWQLTEVGADFVAVLGGWQQHAARGRASYLGSLQPDSWLDVLVQTPVRLAYFLGTPFAWMVAGVRDLWGFLDGTFLLLLCVRLVAHSIRGRAWRRRAYATVALMVAVAIIGFSVVTSNYGTAFRHRAKFVPALFVLYGCAASQRRHGAEPRAGASPRSARSDGSR